MSEQYDKEIERLHERLAVLYRRGILTQDDHLQVQGLWARIERLTTISVRIDAKEDKRG